MFTTPNTFFGNNVLRIKLMNEKILDQVEMLGPMGLKILNDKMFVIAVDGKSVEMVSLAIHEAHGIGCGLKTLSFVDGFFNQRNNLGGR